MIKQLDLLLINPGGRRSVYQGLQDADITAVETPVWCGLIAGFVRKHGFTAAVYDINAEGCENVHALWACPRPRLTAVVCYGQQPSASTQTMPAAIQLAKDLKKGEHKVIMVPLTPGLEGLIGRRGNLDLEHRQFAGQRLGVRQGRSDFQPSRL